MSLYLDIGGLQCPAPHVWGGVQQLCLCQPIIGKQFHMWMSGNNKDKRSTQNYKNKIRITFADTKATNSNMPTAQTNVNRMLFNITRSLHIYYGLKPSVCLLDSSLSLNLNHQAKFKISISIGWSLEISKSAISDILYKQYQKYRQYQMDIIAYILHTSKLNIL